MGIGKLSDEKIIQFFYMKLQQLFACGMLHCMKKYDAMRKCIMEIELISMMGNSIRAQALTVYGKTSIVRFEWNFIIVGGGSE